VYYYYLLSRKVYTFRVWMNMNKYCYNYIMKKIHRKASGENFKIDKKPNIF